ncbi:MAG: CdaR family protein, partial [Treponema sp.]|nr:CdaR family protein [Treponema sp.]
DIEAYVDFSRYESEGLYRAPVQIRKKGTALEVEPLEISVSPMEISLRVDRKISKTLPLTAAVRGRVAPGYDLVSYSVSPPDAVITGPLGILEPFLELETEPVELEGKNADFTVPVNIVVPNPLFVLRGNGTAEFQGHVRPAIPVRNFEGLPIVITGLDPRFTADTVERRGSVRLEGGQSQLESFKPPDGFLSVDCSGLSRPGTYTLPVLISLPGGFYLIRQEPEELVLIISLKEESP